MARQLSIVERAFELARSGRYARCDDIAKALSLEGYEAAANHLNAPSLRRQLLEAMRFAAVADEGDSLAPVA